MNNIQDNTNVKTVSIAPELMINYTSLEIHMLRMKVVNLIVIKISPLQR